jgi:hypothetical protein
MLICRWNDIYIHKLLVDVSKENFNIANYFNS